MEVADFFIVNKSERDGRDIACTVDERRRTCDAVPGGDCVRRPPAPLPNSPPIFAVSAELGHGIDGSSIRSDLAASHSIHISSTTENAAHA
jgi:hypothetical protein